MDTRSPPLVSVRVLGGFELHGAAGGDVSLSGKKLRALVALLALPPSHGWSREQLMTFLWGDRDEELARGSLRQALAELRRALGEQAVLADRETVAFDPAAIRIDAVEFGALSAAGDWEQAAALYRGDLLTGVPLPNGGFADWLLVERTRLHDQAVRALEQVLGAQSGDVAIATAQRLLDLDPVREQTYRTLMRLHAAKGDRSQALRCYQLCRDRLWRELGVKPEPETERLLAELKLPVPPRETPAVAPVTPSQVEVTVPATGPRLHWQRWTAAAAILVIAAACALALWLGPWLSPGPPAGPPSVAVLPFENLSDDPQQAYFADGIAEDLMTDLSHVKGLFVIARNSTFAYRGKAVDVQRVARELGVRYVIGGSVRRSGDQVRINVQLADAASAKQQWAQRYDGSLSDVFALQGQVASAVVGALSLRLSAGELQSLTQHETASLEAYDAFLRGWDHYKHATPDELAKAIPYLEQAVEFDKAYGRAYAALAMIHFQAYDQGWAGRLNLSADNAYRRARDLLKRAQLNPTATAHQVAGNMARALGWFEDALAEFKAAIALDPNDSWSYAYMAHALIAAGRPAEALAQIELATRLDPHPPPIFVFYRGWAEFTLNQLDAAAATLERATALDPENPWPWLYLVATYGSSGRMTESRASLAAYNRLRIAQGGIPLTLNCYFLKGQVFFFLADKLGLEKGLMLAGVPRWFEVREFDRQKLSPEQMDSLLFGHRIHGRTLESGVEHGAMIAADGTAMMFGDWGYGAGTARVDNNQVCFAWTSGLTNCGVVYRNPGGTRAKENEFIWFSHGHGGFSFSVVE